MHKSLNVNAIGMPDRTVLIEASERGLVGVVRELLQHNCMNVNAKHIYMYIWARCPHGG
jgi:hypothetical protein